MVILDTSNNLEAMKVEKIMYLTFLHKIIYHSIQLISTTLSHIVLYQMVQYLLSYIWICQHIQSLSSNAALSHLSAQKFIPLYSPDLCDSITHSFVQNGAVYIQFTPPAHPIHQNCPFWEKYSHHYRPLIIHNPYPSKPVPHCAGVGKLGLWYR